jgi:hypothetical protein
MVHKNCFSLGKWERENQLGLQKTKKNWLDQYKIVQP